LVRSNSNAGVQIDQLIITGNREQANLGIFLGRLAQTLGDERMILAQERSNHQSSIEILDLSQAHAQPWRTFSLEIGGEVTLTRTEIDIAATQPLHDPAEQEQFFQRRTLGSQRGKRITAMFAGHVLQAVGDVIEGNIPVA